MASIEQYPLDTTHALYNPSNALLIALVTSLLSTGLWKIGSCYEDLLGTRPRDAAQYNPTYFNRDGAVCLCYGLIDKAYAALLETAGIQHAKFNLKTGVNTKSKDDTPHDGYRAERPGALYAVPVLPHVATTQAGFKEVHVSRHMMITHGNTTKEERKADKEERKAAKRAKLLDELIAAIPMQQLQRAFQSESSPRELWKLQHKYHFKESNNGIYKELRALFEERY